MRGVYQITNKVNGKRYIGSTTKSFRKRWRQHINDLNGGRHKNHLLQEDWNKYGKEGFQFCAVFNMPYSEKSTVEQIEQHYIDICNDKYNIVLDVITNPFYGRTFSNATKKKMSDAKKNKPLTDRHKKNIRDSLPRGKDHWTRRRGISDRIKKKISTSLTGRKLSDEHAKNMGRARMGANAPLAKLTNNEVLSIREIYKSGGHSHRELAKMFGVCKSSIGNIIRRKTWRHI